MYHRVSLPIIFANGATVAISKLLFDQTEKHIDPIVKFRQGIKWFHLKAITRWYKIQNWLKRKILENKRLSAKLLHERSSSEDAESWT